MSTQLKKGFTLIELILVIGILALLLAITLIAINPSRQFAQANNTKRQSDVRTILNGISDYQADNKGALPAGLSAVSCPASTPCEITGVAGASNIDLCTQAITRYVAAVPVDPSINNGTNVGTCNNTYDSGYQVSVSATDSRVTVIAPHAELGATISITR